MSWIVVALGAALLQTTRNSFQKSLAKKIPAEMLTLIRFLFGWPIAVIVLGALWASRGMVFPEHNNWFMVYALIAAVTQIIGNILLVTLFSRRNFVVGITYTKMEIILSAIIAFVGFGETISTGGMVAIMIGFLGIMLISASEQQTHPLKMIKGAFNHTALLGLMCGAFYAVTGVMVRQSTLALASDDTLMKAMTALTVIMTIQVILLGAWVSIKYKGQIKKIAHYPLESLVIGITNTLGSLGWYVAFALVQTAYVLTVGQVEVFISLVTTHRIFKERIDHREIVGVALVVTSVIALIFLH